MHATTGKEVVLLGVTSDAPIAPDTVYIRVDSAGQVLLLMEVL